MFYLRISLLTPLQGHVRETVRLLDEITNYCSEQRGYLGAYVLERHEGSEAVGRVTLWETQSAADAVAQEPHMLALRARLNLLVVEGTHQELGFLATRAPVTRAHADLLPGEAVHIAREILAGQSGSSGAA